LTGAALASMISVFIFVVIKFIFIKIKFGFQPYNIRYLYISVIIGVTYLIVNIIPTVSFTFLDIFIKGVSICLIFIPLIYFSKVSIDINNIMEKNIDRFFRR